MSINKTHDALKKFMYDLTRGLVRLRPEDSEKLARIVKDNAATVVLYKYNMQQDIYERARTIQTSDDEVRRLAMVYGGRPPIEKFARWELIDSTGEKIAVIYNLNYTII